MIFVCVTRIQVNENLTSSQRAHLISVWCNYKCRLCCHLRVDAASSPENALFTISGGLPSSSSAPPPPYDVALSMPRVTAGSVVRFQISDGHVFEFKMDSSTSCSLSSACSSEIEPPRFIDDNPTTTGPSSSTRHSRNQASSSIGVMRVQHHVGPRHSASLPVLPSSLCRSSCSTIPTTTMASDMRPNDVTIQPTGLRVGVETNRPPTSIVIHVATAYGNERDTTRF